jgi:hypothetical protein
MAFPGRVFIVAGKDEVDSVVDSDRKRQAAEANMRQMRNERDAAVQTATSLRAGLEQMQRIAAITLLILIIFISIVLWLWLSSRGSGAPSQSQSSSESSKVTPPTESKPIPRSPPQQNPHSRTCKRGCDPPGYWEYDSWRFHNPPRYHESECWRDRSIRGPCFY